ncbi:serine/threonine protein kinase [Streptomyces albus]|uniref:non-specific serine/threonine protein kinase n=1 Tax=Streptomyces albus (strain ATCC 21838 / DSM 41398 / FERM P-419 / JCM 4703 / NBRC 107858) TaxID=1081613 RepID=A0A0B5EPD6_STRA4|nr:serine/threonine protein kinase [Streptomyces albus]AOU77728.1 serine/threonine protein kinase [Streptomyces albus]AYN33490.1 serine/threonine protein kinase [Streptomyces albus]
MARGQRIADRCAMRMPIGHRAMREVWKCTDLHLRRLVALNFIRPELHDFDDERQRIVRCFRRETAALAGVDHPHVATVHNARGWKTMQHLVMQLVPGVATVVDLVSEHSPLAMDAAGVAGAQITAGLSAVRAARLVHRGSQTAERRGGAQRHLEDHRLQSGGRARRHPHTIDRPVRGHDAPDSQALEQEGGPHSHVDHRADLYSPGCLLYFMPTEEPPSTASIPALVMLALRTSTPPALASFRHDLPPDLEDLVLRLLAKHPGEQHADATSVESLLAPHIPASTPDASWGSFPDPGMDITRPSRFPASPRPLATRVDNRAWGRR